MARRDTVGAIRRPSQSGGRDEDRPKFICCVDGRQPEINEVCTLREDSVTTKVHLTALVDVGVFVGELRKT